MRAIAFVIAVLLTAGCPPSLDDDDTTGDDDTVGDDDTAGDDDTGPGDDDVSPGGDDDTADDDTGPDDDDATLAGGAISLSAPYTDFGDVEVNQSSGVVVTIENIGSSFVAGGISFSNNYVTVYLMTGASSFSIAPGNSIQRTVTFNPQAIQAYPTTFTVTHDGTGNASPQTLQLTGNGVGPGESNCTDTLDNDGDGDFDCDDSDCGADPACVNSDFCCGPGDTTTYTLCWDNTARNCVCAMDTFCCDGINGWDSNCVNEYIVNCGSTTCGP
jgi:hypothetical protein